MKQNIQNKSKQGLIEKLFESSLWSMRFLVMFAVIFSLISSFILFIVASTDVLSAAKLFLSHYLSGQGVSHFHEIILAKIIASVDLYLIAVVLLIFSFGIYELFISHIDIADNNESSSILEIGSLDELKNKITKVIIMVLIVSFFQGVLSIDFKTPLEMLYLAVSIFVLSIGLYFLHKNDHK